MSTRMLAMQAKKAYYKAMPSETIKHLEIETYELHSVKVMVQIDYDKEKISLMEKSPNGGLTPKKWVFADREVGYMAGWRNILAAMEMAFSAAEVKLKKHLAHKEKNEVKFQIRVAKMLAKEAKPTRHHL